jgi:hypothetical protein
MKTWHTVFFFFFFDPVPDLHFWINLTTCASTRPHSVLNKYKFEGNIVRPLPLIHLHALVFSIETALLTPGLKTF